MFARLPDGRTIEEAWQLDCKGYRQFTNNWKDAKGKKPLEGFDPTYADYKALWVTWAKVNPELMRELATLAVEKDYYLSDVFANTAVSQARALSEILNGDY